MNLQRLLRSAILKKTLETESEKRRKKHSEVPNRAGKRLLKDITDFSMKQNMRRISSSTHQCHTASSIDESQEATN